MEQMQVGMIFENLSPDVRGLLVSWYCIVLTVNEHQTYLVNSVQASFGTLRLEGESPPSPPLIDLLIHEWTTDWESPHTALSRWCVEHFKEAPELGFKIFNNFASYFSMEMPHFECGWLIGEEICLSRWYQFFLLIYNHSYFSRKLPFYLFITYLLDFIDSENEKPFKPYDRRLAKVSFLSIVHALEMSYW